MARSNCFGPKCVFLRIAGIGILGLAVIGLAADALHASPLPGRAAPPPSYEIHLPSGTETPAEGISADLVNDILQDIGHDPQPSPYRKRAHILVQLHEPPSVKVRSELAAQGVMLLEPLSKTTWYASVTTIGADFLASDPLLEPRARVRYAKRLVADDKFDPALLGADAPTRHHLLPRRRRVYTVIYHRDVSPDEGRMVCERVARGRLQYFNAATFPIFRSVLCEAPADGHRALAGSDLVVRVEPAPPPTYDLNVDHAQKLSKVAVLRETLHGLDGTGINVGVWEAKGSILDTHPDLQEQPLPEPPEQWKSRVTLEEPADDRLDAGGHATHVAGTIASSGVKFPDTQGMAPKATLSCYDTRPRGDLRVRDKMILAGQGADGRQRVQIANHSHGPKLGWVEEDGEWEFRGEQSLFGTYTDSSKGYDQVVRVEELIVVQAAGNDRNDLRNLLNSSGPEDCKQNESFKVETDCQDQSSCVEQTVVIDADCILPQGVAKNVLTVGAMQDEHTVWEGSAFGPTNDGRIKPDLVAHGYKLWSLDLNDDQSYRKGTSMAAPVVSGIAALVLQEARRRKAEMTPAGMKALLVQTAEDVRTDPTPGTVHRLWPGPDYATGWGIVDAEAAVNLLRKGGLVHGSLDDINKVWTHDFYVPEGLDELRITLAWDDAVNGPVWYPCPNGVCPDPPPPPPWDPQIVNDLDLMLISHPGQNQSVYLPWKLDPAQPWKAAIPNGGVDTRNNVEQVYVPDPPDGAWRVVVSASSIDTLVYAGSSSGTVPVYSPVYGDQPFAVAGPLQRSDVVLVMDRSGSMSLPSGDWTETKIQALKNAANEFVDLLDLAVGHRLGLAQFNQALVPFKEVLPDGPDVSFELQNLSESARDRAHLLINNMGVGGMTNIIAGVEEGHRQLRDLVTPLPRQSMVVFSDGKHNRPLGTQLSSVAGTVYPNDTHLYTFYSLGFGTDVDDDDLEHLASLTGGIHLNEQDLDPDQLKKYFLTIGALIYDLSILSDPPHNVKVGSPARQEFALHGLDRSLYLAVNGKPGGLGHLALVVESPDPDCTFPLEEREGVRFRAGDGYRLARVDLPYDCDGTKVHQGTWTLKVDPGTLPSGRVASVDVMILVDSGLELDAGFEATSNPRRWLLTAKLLENGNPISSADLSMQSEILYPIPATHDSAAQDATPRRQRNLNPRPRATRKSRTHARNLNDRGKSGDTKAGDGTHSWLETFPGQTLRPVALLPGGPRATRVRRFSGPLALPAPKPGLYQARVVATYKRGGLELTREAFASLYLPAPGPKGLPGIQPLDEGPGPMSQ